MDMEHFKTRVRFKQHTKSTPPSEFGGSDIAIDILDKITSIDESKNIVMVEGRTDAYFYRLFIDFISTSIIDVEDLACNKKAIIETLQAIDESRDTEMKVLQQRTIGFVDCDLDDKRGLMKIPNLMVTDTRDIETMVMSSSSFDRFMEGKFRGDPSTKKKLDLAITKRGTKDLRSTVLDLSSEFSTIKTSGLWISYQASIRNIDPASYISNDLHLDSDRLIADVAKMARVSPSDVRRKMITVNGLRRNEPWSLCEGHDSIRTLSAIMNRFFYQSWPPGQRPTCIDIWKDLQTLYAWPQFRETKMYGSILKWEKSNNRTILSDRRSAN